MAEMDELVETAFDGPGNVECISLCVAGFDVAAGFGRDRVAFFPITSERRLRVYAGNFNLVAPWREHLVFTVPRGHAATDLLFGLGAEETPGPKLHPNLAVIHAPRGTVAPHAGLLLLGLSAAAKELAPASRCPRRNNALLEQAMRERARSLN